MKAGLLARLARLETRLDPAHAWRSGEGLASLLDAPRRLPHRDPWAMPDLESGGSMARLLAEARRAISAREEEDTLCSAGK